MEAFGTMDITVAVTIVIVTVMVEFGGLWLRPLSQDLFSARVVK